MKMAFKLMIYCLINGLLEVNAEPTAEESTKERNHHPYVVNGQDADPHEYPWQVLLKQSGRFICGGSLIDKQWVLTAAHCVNPNTNPAIFTVDVGVHNRQQPTAVQKTYAVKGIRYHKNYNSKNIQYDVALILLDGIVEIGDKIKPIALPPQNNRIAPGKMCFVTGWGLMNGSISVTANTLQEASLKIGNYSHCNAKNLNIVHDPTMLCAGSEGKGSCNGDSGGPLSCYEGGKWVLRGVVSWGIPRCPTSFYSVFARVSSFITWIDKTKQGVFDCDFEQNLCYSWEQDTEDKFDWTRHKGPTPSAATGPSVDHTTGSNKGFYMYIESTSPRISGDVARLISKPLPATNHTCLSFWYHMYGTNINTLRVLIKKGLQTTTVFTKSGNMGNRWQLGQVDITSTVDVQVIFKGVVGGGYEGDIAIDDIKFIDGICTSPALANCDFEEHVCFWRQEHADDFEWTRHRFTTPSSKTGPSVDHTTGSATGYYMFIESSTPREMDHKARLVSGIHPPTENRCLSFWYHMYGEATGTLKVIVKKGVQQTVVLSLTGESGNQWLKGNATVQSAVNYELIFEAVIGTNFLGDIAIDDVSFTSGSCKHSITYDCNFEENVCYLWDQDTLDKIDWTRHKGATASNNTGPTVDHTTKTSSGYYMYIESSAPRKENDTGRLISKPLSPTNNGMLTFWYHMYGYYINTLRVLIKKGLKETTVWTKQGNQGNRWIDAKVSLTSQEPFQIIIEGNRGSGFLGDMAIDDIALSNVILYQPNITITPPTTNSPPTTTQANNEDITTTMPPTTTQANNEDITTTMPPTTTTQGNNGNISTTMPPTTTQANDGNISTTMPPTTTQGTTMQPPITQAPLRCYHCTGKKCAGGERQCDSQDHVCAKIEEGTKFNRTCINGPLCLTYCDTRGDCTINCCSDKDLCNQSATLKPIHLWLILAMLSVFWLNINNN